MQNYFFTEEEFKDIQCSAFTEEQLILLREPTPESEIEIKTDKDGTTHKSVKGSYMKKRMNLIFGFNHDFEIKSREFFPLAGEVLVEGRLTIRSQGYQIIKEQFGKFIMNTSKNGRNEPSGIGNAYKSATTDAFKKCASEIGLCWDIYSQEQQEEKPAEDVKPVEEDYSAKKITERLEHFLKNQSTEEALDTVFKQFEDNNKVNDIHKDLLAKYKEQLLEKESE